MGHFIISANLTWYALIVQSFSIDYINIRCRPKKRITCV